MKNKLLRYSLIVLGIFILIIYLTTPKIYAIGGYGDADNPEYYQPSEMRGTDEYAIGMIGGYIIKVMRTIAIIVATLVIAILGIKYMLGSVEEKAEYKKSMMPYLIGILMIVVVFSLISVIAQTMQYSKPKGSLFKMIKFTTQIPQNVINVVYNYTDKGGRE